VPYLAPVGTPNPFDAEHVSTPIWWPEGEKDVDTLQARGLLAFTFGGASDVWEGSESILTGRHVIVSSDNDEPGLKSAAQTVELAAKVASRVQVVHFPELPEKKDVSDWLEDYRGTVDKLWRRVEDAKPQPTPSRQPDHPPPRLAAMNGKAVLVERDLVEIAPETERAAEFPVDFLPPVMRGAVEALEEHVQAPRGLCAHSVLSAGRFGCPRARKREDKGGDEAETVVAIHARGCSERRAQNCL
jgi:hypothetical protein